MTKDNEQTGLMVSQSANDLMPAMSLPEAKQRYDQMVGFVKEIMIEGVDFGEIPGTSKATLLKPGAEKLTTFFGLTVKFVDEHTIEDFDKPLFFYRRKCQLWRGDHLIAEASGSCNSMEDRYAWRWVPAHEVPAELDKATLGKRVSSIGEWGWAYEKRETTGKYGKPEEYWAKFDKAIETNMVNKIMKEQPWKNNEKAVFLEIESVLYRVPNENIFTLVNTILKMAEKRALVAATLVGCNASEFFTQDMEDIAGAVLGNDYEVIDVTPKEVKKEPAKTAEKTDAKTATKPPAKKGAESASYNLSALRHEDLNIVIGEAGALAAAGGFPPEQYVYVCDRLGFAREASMAKKDCGGDFNAAVLHLIGLKEQGADSYAPPSQDELPF